MIPREIEYVRATSFEEAFDGLANPDARALAGGQSLLPLMKLRLARPASLVDIGSLDFRGIAETSGEIRIGALATWDEIASSSLLASTLPALGESAARVGDLQVRNRGTIGGSLAHSDPASDVVAALVALGGKVRLRSPVGQRDLLCHEFLQGAFTTALEPQELIVEVLVPKPGPAESSAYFSVEHPASRYPVAGAAVLVAPEGDVIKCLVGLTGVASRPVQLVVPNAEQPNEVSVALESALAAVDVLSDTYADAVYRRYLAGVVVRRALELAVARIKAGKPDDRSGR